MEKNADLVFIPIPGVGHLVSAVELAKLFMDRDEHLSVVFLIIQLSFDTGVDAYIESNSTDPTSRIRFLKVPPQQSAKPESKSKIRAVVAFEMINTFKPQVRDVVADMISRSKVAGIVVDMFCSGMVDVANELQLPSYVFFSSGAAFLGLELHAQSLYDEHKDDISDYKDSDAELLVPSYKRPVPAKVLPSLMLDKNGGSDTVFTIGRKMRETKGIIINTFLELEPYAIESLSDPKGKIPPIYPIGPMINRDFRSDDEVIAWLDSQPCSSVVFLCFGTFGSFGSDQLKEIAVALERGGWRFLWSLRQPAAQGSIAAASACANPGEILPAGFLERTSGVGRVISWAPQMAVLEHPSVGGFVSHCGWNSILESLWAGVPLAAWPMYAEQQVNAFQVVADLGLAVEVKMDYRHDADMESLVAVSAHEIEKAIGRIMRVDGNEVAQKVKQLMDKCRKAVLEHGSSYVSLGNLVSNIRNNIV